MNPRSRPGPSSPLYRLGLLEPFLQAGEKPFIKQLNWYTGFGKTYTAAAFAIELFQQHRVIPVFIAPLQSLVAGFAGQVRGHGKGRHDSGDEIEQALRDKGAGLPVYRLYSIDYHQNDRSFFGAAQGLAGWLRANARRCRHLWRAQRDQEPGSSFESQLTRLDSGCTQCLKSLHFKLSPGDDAYQALHQRYLQLAKGVIGLADDIARKLIALDADERARDPAAPGCLGEPAVAEIVRRLHPLQLFLRRPGLIVCTASKALVQQHVHASPDGQQPPCWQVFDSLPLLLQELNREGSALGRQVSGRSQPARVVTFIDEEEESYWYLFDQRKSVVNRKGRHDLNLVITEFFSCFDLQWPLAFDDGARGRSLAEKLYWHLEDFAAVAPAVERESGREQQRTGARHVPVARRPQILRAALQERAPATAARFDDAELLQVLQQLHDRNDAQHGFKRYRQKARVLALLRHHVRRLNRGDGPDYEAFRELRERVFDKKYFIIDRCSYGEVLEQPAQTFFDESANVMDTDFLRRVELRPDAGHRTLRLHHHESQPPASAYTLLDYLQLVLLVARVLAARGAGHEIEFSAQDIERYPNLDRFRTEARELFSSALSAEGLEQLSSGDELIGERFVYLDTKSVVTLEQSRWRPKEYNDRDLSLTLAITTLRASPEQDIADALGRSNGVYLISATGGLDGASSGSFNTARLRRLLDDKGGLFMAISDAELEEVARQAQRQRLGRERRVAILDEANPGAGLGVSPGYRGLREEFRKMLRQKEPEAGRNRYKLQEIDGLLASLDRLLSSDLRSGLVLCQTVGRIHSCLSGLVESGAPWIEPADAGGQLFLIKPARLPAYRQFGAEEIMLVLYKASSFRRREATEGEEQDDAAQFSQNLVNALDISKRKVLLWSAYASASRGINFVTTCAGLRRDFELFCLLNDPYYTRHTRSSEPGFSIEGLQSFVQVLHDRDPGRIQLSRDELLYRHQRERWSVLRAEHAIDSTRTLFQALGRGEREPEAAMPCQWLYLGSQAAQALHSGLRHVPQLRGRASPAQRAVLEQIDRHVAAMAIFDSAAARSQHLQASLKSAVAFRRFTSELPRRFRSDAEVRRVWSALFDCSMFQDPRRYLKRLEAAGVPADWRQSCYWSLPPQAVPYLRQFAGPVRETVLTDVVDGEERYDWIAWLAPDRLVERGLLRGDAAADSLRHRDGFVTEGGDRKLLPQPWFVTEIMRGYIAELEFERYLLGQFGLSAQHPVAGELRLLDPAQHPQSELLYQRFDYYLELGSGALVAIDIKNWGRLSDRLGRDELLEQAQRKQALLAEQLPGRQVHAVYLNLCGAHKHSVSRPSRGSIRFLSMFVPGVEHDKPRIVNDKLADALLGL